MKRVSSTFICLAFLFSVAKAFLPYQDPIRGVNLGGLFIVEPWMMYDEWNSMGCGGQQSEFDCVMHLGQAAANTAFQKHWASWITQDDINQIVNAGLNTIRIPLGYWIYEDIVDKSSEHFPQGGFQYLERLCEMARDAGLYIILDLHGAPGAQQAYQPFTGQFASTPGFYNSYNYERAYKFLEWLAQTRHTNDKFSNVGTIEVVNEPLQGSATPQSLIDTFYPTAWQRIRAVENRLNVASNNRLHIQMMDSRWGSGDPNKYLSDLYFAFYDDHEYPRWNTNVVPTRNDYVRFSCHDNVGGNWPVIVGEWSLAVREENENGSEFSLQNADAVAWYRKWWAAQVMSYEKQRGWLFWTWKVNWINGKNDWRWGYQQAIAAGVIPKNPADAYTYGACDGY